MLKIYYLFFYLSNARRYSMMVSQIYLTSTTIEKSYKLLANLITKLINNITMKIFTKLLSKLITKLLLKLIMNLITDLCTKGVHLPL